MSEAESLTQQNPGHPRMSARKRFVIGGIGCLAPLLGTVYFSDAALVAGYLQGLGEDPVAVQKLIGYFLARTPFLFLLGGFWAYLHQSEHDPLKVFQLGIVAPAMVLGMVNAANVDDERGKEQSNAWLSIVSEAHAQATPTPTPTPIPTPWDGFIRGLLGRP